MIDFEAFPPIRSFFIAVMPEYQDRPSFFCSVNGCRTRASDSDSSMLASIERVAMCDLLVSHKFGGHMLLQAKGLWLEQL